MRQAFAGHVVGAQLHYPTLLLQTDGDPTQPGPPSRLATVTRWQLRRQRQNVDAGSWGTPVPPTRDSGVSACHWLRRSSSPSTRPVAGHE